MKICPRCHRSCLHEGEDEALNSISHVGDHVQICSKCGLEQGNVGMYNTKDIVEIEMELRFRKELGL